MRIKSHQESNRIFIAQTESMKTEQDDRATAPETKPGFCRLYVRENKRLAMYLKSRKFAPWLKDNRRDMESIG